MIKKFIDKARDQQKYFFKLITDDEVIELSCYIIHGCGVEGYRKSDNMRIFIPSHRIDNMYEYKEDEQTR